MSYTPHTWQTGETVTAAKLNALEQGVASGGGGNLVVTMTIEYNTPGQNSATFTLNATWQDISAAIAAGKYVCSVSSGEQTVQTQIVSYSSYVEDETTTYVIGDFWDNYYTTNSQTGYPSRVVIEENVS